jgi:alpha-2-macroglobulin
MDAMLRRLPLKRSYTLVALILIFSLLLPLVWPGSQPGPVEAKMLGQAVSPARSEPIPPSPGSGGSGLQITLSEGSQQLTTTETITVAPATPLSDIDTKALLDRLPPLTTTVTDTQEFRLPDAPLPPPRPGVTIAETFPPTQTAPAPTTVEGGPLEVVRYAPEGEITIAPFLNVTFNQPMVPLGTLEQLSDIEVPVQITPDLPGVWRWLGTKTLNFEYQSGDLDIDHFPKATIYTVTVPAGTRSAIGGELAEDVTWTFRTPPPALEYTYPTGGPQPTDPLLFIRFDQGIQPDAVLETITVTAGGQTFPIRLANQEELAAVRQVQNLIANSREDRWIAFRSEEDFPNDTTVTVNVGPGTPSAEGPLTTETVQSYSFTTYAPLRLVEATCGWGSECPPLSPFYLRFNNPLNEALFDPALVTVEPEVPGLVVNAYNNTIEIRGNTQGRTSYTVTVRGDLQDLFGQTLGQDETRTFQTGPANRFLGGPNSNFVTLDPSSTRPVFSLYSINYDRLRVRIYRVTPEDWPAYQRWQNEESYRENPADPPGRELYAEIVRIETADDALVETSIDLSNYLNDGRGHLIVWVDYPAGLLSSLFSGRDYNRIVTWVQSTQIGLDAIVDRNQLFGWATRLTDGSPLTEIELTLAGTDQRATTGEDGLARFDLSSRGAYALVGRSGNDVALLPSNMYYYYGGENSGWRQQPTQDQLRWFVFDDRQMYRPGEEVHLKGWLRLFEDRADGDIALTTDAPNAIQYTVSDPQGNQIAQGAADVNDLGGFDLAFTLPENVNLGHASIYLNARGAGNYGGIDTYHSIQIQEFRRPEFAVTARNEDTGPYFVGDEAVLAVNAQYFAGGPLPNADTTWTVNTSPSSYAPPKWPDYTFGKWMPWWRFDYGYTAEIAYGRPSSGAGGTSTTYQSRTDATGTHYLRIHFDDLTDPRPYSVLAEGRVMDVNRQAWAASTSLLVHPSTLYVGMRSATYFVEQGQPLEVDLIVTDVDGNPIAGVPITVRAARLEWKYSGGRWQETEADPQECTVESAGEPVRCTFETTVGGEYRISATVEDAEGRINRSEFQRWVSGGQRPAVQRVEQEEVSIIPDQESYQPGDVARLLVQSPFSPAEGLVTISRGDILTTERFTIDDGTFTLEIPIEDAHIPNLTVQVDLNGSAPRTDAEGEPLADVAPRPAYATGRIELPIPPLSRKLSLTLEPEATALEPGAETALDLVVTDAEGEPVENAELAVVVVDEAILALTNYMLADPVAAFYSPRYSNVSATYGRGSIILATPEQLAEGVATGAQQEMARSLSMDSAAVGAAAPTATPAAAAPMEYAEEAADGAAAQPGEAITIRTDFNPLATFAPAVRTDADGRARVEYKLPDNLTRYRIMVVAVAEGKYFGSSESNITARLPLMVRPSAPRFLNFGDQFELPVIVQNQTDEAIEVQVAVRASNLQSPPISQSPEEGRFEEIEGFEAGQQVTVPANDRVEVRFPVATANAGTVRAQIAVAAGAFADAANLELPVYTPATTEAFAVYGVVDEGAIAQPVAQPENVFPQFGGLEISTSSTALQALTDAVLYLVSYRFECSEQLASRILGVAALRDVLTAFEAEGLPAPEEMEKAVARDIERLRTLQNDNGGWPIWERGDESVPYYSIHVTHALQRAKLKGFDVPEETLGRALDHLRNIESYYPSYYSETVRHSLSAYALYVRQLMGDVDTGKARDLLNRYPLEEQSLEAIAWIWQVLSDDPASTAEVEAIRRHVNNRAVETAGAANFVTSYGEQAYLLLHSNRRTDGIVLDALINDQPDSDLIPKVVAGLLAHKTAGRWNNTQENVFILLALDRYFNTYEAQTPDFVARIWLGDTYAAEHEFRGRTTETRQTLVPMSYLVDDEQAPVQSLVIDKDGDGRLYYRLGLRYAPTDLDLPPLDMGFVVQRTYEPVDSPDDVRLDENGIWRIRAGARVRVRVNMVAENRRYHVALVDPLPAGLEIINPALATSERVPSDPNARPTGWWWWRQWYQHQNLRDERAEAFTTLLWEGVYEYTYVARATTPGEFIVPPAKAEEMYSPEVFGRSAVDRVVVE